MKGVGKPTTGKPLNQVQKLLEKVQKLKKDIMEAKCLHFKKVARWKKVCEDQETIIKINHAMMAAKDEEIKQLKDRIVHFQQLASSK